MKLFPLLIALIAALPLSLRAQEDLRIWALTGANFRINSQWELRVNELYGFNPEPRDEESGEKDPALSFVQHGVHVRYRPIKSISLFSGADVLVSNGSPEERSIGHRLSGAVQHSVDVEDFVIRQTLRYEWFTPLRSRYGHRLLYSVRGEYDIDDAPWDLSPYAGVELGYYAGGDPIAYYTPEGSLLDSAAPSGLHRFRGSLGIAARPHRLLNVSLFYMIQREFNVGQNPIGQLNYYDPVADRTRYRFNGYSVLGVSAKFRLRLESGESRKSPSPAKEKQSEILIPDPMAE
jgi:hypothetical protein